MQALLTSLLLPPLVLVLGAALGGLLAWRGWRPGGLLVMALAALQLLLATPAVSGRLLESLERGIGPVPPGAPAAAAIIVLGAEGQATAEGLMPGPLTLERLRAGAALHRRTGLPLLVTAGVVVADTPPLAEAMARSLAEDFAVPVAWREKAARDTRENAALSVALLRGAGIEAAHLVTHAWHLPRAMEAFARLGFVVHPAPVNPPAPARPGGPWDWAPRADHLGTSWFALREWAGRAVYALRD
jgi:uncharacterized SAM-binding protein YcdF (DUF218 family)